MKEKPDPRIKTIISYYNDKYITEVGEPWYFNGGKIGKLIKSLLAVYGEDKLKSMIDVFFKDKDPFTFEAGLSFEIFHSMVNKISFKMGKYKPKHNRAPILDEKPVSLEDREKSFEKSKQFREELKKKLGIK